MSDPEEIVEGVLAMMMEEHAEDIARLATAQTLGKATRIWWDDAAEALRFEVID